MLAAKVMCAAKRYSRCWIKSATVQPARKNVRTRPFTGIIVYPAMLFVIVQDNGSTLCILQWILQLAKGFSREASSGKIEHIPIEGVATGLRVNAIAGNTDQCIEAYVTSSQAKAMLL